MKYKLCGNVAIEEICGNYLLIACGEAKYEFEYVRVLNEVGARILIMAQEMESSDEIVQELANEYEMPVDEIRPGIFNFLHEMKSKGYLIVIEGDNK